MIILNKCLDKIQVKRDSRVRLFFSVQLIERTALILGLRPEKGTQMLINKNTDVNSNVKHSVLQRQQIKIVFKNFKLQYIRK